MNFLTLARNVKNLRNTNSLKQKEKEEQQLQSNINELKQLTEQKRKQIETLQGEVKIAVSQKVMI